MTITQGQILAGQNALAQLQVNIAQFGIINLDAIATLVRLTQVLGPLVHPDGLCQDFGNVERLVEAAQAFRRKLKEEGWIP